MPDSPQSGLRALSQATYLRNLATLVFLGTVAAALADYVFKVRAVAAFGNGDLCCVSSPCITRRRALWPS